MPATTGQPPAGAPDLTASSVAGVWNATVSGQSCKVATPQTKFGQGYRAGPLRCPAPLDITWSDSRLTPEPQSNTNSGSPPTSTLMQEVLPP